MSYKETKYSRNLFVVLKDTVVELYNHLGYTILTSVIWLLVIMPFVIFLITTLRIEQGEQGMDNPIGLLFMFLFVLTPYTALLIGPVNCALFHLVNQAAEGWAGLRDLWVGLRKHYRQAAGVYALYSAALLFLLVDMLICFSMLTSLLAKIIGVLLLYLFLFLALSGIYLPPLIVLQENTWKKVFKKAFLLTLDNGPFTLFAMVIILVVGVLFSFLLPLLVLVYGGFLQFFTLRIFLGLLEKYEEKAAESDSA